MAKRVFGLFGAGGFAREVMPIARQTFANQDAEIFFVVPTPEVKEINGVSVLSEREFFSIECGTKLFNIAIADSKLREQIAETCISRGLLPQTLRSELCTIYDENSIGEGAILCANCVITSNATIGKFFHSNIFSYVAHDCEIGDFVTFAPRVNCNGNVRIDKHAYIGTAAVLREGAPRSPLVIGEGALVGMGSVVTKSVERFTTVLGNPAKCR